MINSNKVTKGRIIRISQEKKQARPRTVESIQQQQKNIKIG